MARILLRSGKDPFTPLSPEASLARNGRGVFGANIGNALFSGSIHRALTAGGNEVISDSFATELGGVDASYIARINDEFDLFILPLANAFRANYVGTLDRLAAVLRKLTIPVVVVGVGAQAMAGEKIENIPSTIRESTKNFVSAVLDRSSSIGVRGEFTREVLLNLGFGESSVDIIGCPSLYDQGASLSVNRPTGRLSRESKLALNISRSVEAFSSAIERDVLSYPGLDYFPQEHFELSMLMWGGGLPPDIQMTVDTSHRLYRDDRVKFPLDAHTWIEELRNYDFSYGTRIHGNIAALIAGTPAHVVSHDSRTQELADYHAIPTTPLSRLGDWGAEQLFETSDFDEFNARHPENFGRYVRFLDRNAVPHGLRDEMAIRNYDERLSEVAFASPVHFIAPDSGLRAEDVVGRLHWLRQDGAADKNRSRAGAYVAPFVPEQDAPPRLRDVLAALDAERELVETMRRDISKDQERLKAVMEDLKRYRGALRFLQRLLASRVGRWLARVAGRNSGGQV